MVIGGEDTGYQWDHPILKPQYRGWNGSTADHNYNWHDAIHDAQAAIRADRIRLHRATTISTARTPPAPSPATTARRVAAPSIRRRARREMDRLPQHGQRHRHARASTSNACSSCCADRFERPEPESRSRRGCRQQFVELSDQRRLQCRRAAIGGRCAGQRRRFLRGRRAESGPACSTITDPPALYDSAFVVGATDTTDQLGELFVARAGGRLRRRSGRTRSRPA